MYGLLKDNPLVDSTKLTKYLIDNLVGVQFDDMLQPQEGARGSQTNPMQMGEFAQLQQQGAGNA